MSELTIMERRVLELLDQGMLIDAIAARYNLTRKQVLDVHEKALRKLNEGTGFALPGEAG